MSNLVVLNKLFVGTDEYFGHHVAIVPEMFDMLPLENYKMVFHGNGKMVVLIRIDNEFRGESVIIGETEDNYNFYPIYLHRPKSGSPLELYFRL